jgi:hypothetical protein
MVVHMPRRTGRVNRKKSACGGAVTVTHSGSAGNDRVNGPPGDDVLLRGYASPH